MRSKFYFLACMQNAVCGNKVGAKYRAILQENLLQAAKVWGGCLILQQEQESWQMAAHTEPGSAGDFFLLKGSFPLHCRYMHAQYEGLLQRQCKQLSTVSTCSSRRSECCKLFTGCNLLGFLRQKYF
ncbi:hypothetical protein ILYODFUR_036481 [Ilyodon furcidens]|uniref:Uncharacterized protein n=1 Tax=Ilyodon furcidens TaxID=33524 RepID=A0ABV0UQ42_9TELE